MKRALPMTLLLLGVGATSAVPARSVSPDSTLPLHPITSLEARTMQGAVPTLNLLRTVRLLGEALQKGTVNPDASKGAALRAELHVLLTQPNLGPLAAERAEDRILALLTGAERAELGLARTELKRRAGLLLARARFAAPDGPVNSTAALYSFQVPGGLGLVLRLQVQPSLNPYLESKPNMLAIQRVLAALGTTQAP